MSHTTGGRGGGELEPARRVLSSQENAAVHVHACWPFPRACVCVRACVRACVCMLLRVCYFVRACAYVCVEDGPPWQTSYGHFRPSLARLAPTSSPARITFSICTGRGGSSYMAGQAYEQPRGRGERMESENGGFTEHKLELAHDCPNLIGNVT